MLDQSKFRNFSVLVFFIETYDVEHIELHGTYTYVALSRLIFSNYNICWHELGSESSWTPFSSGVQMGGGGPVVFSGVFLRHILMESVNIPR